MRNFIKYLMVCLLLGSAFPAMAHLGPVQLEGVQNGTITTATLRDDCSVAQNSIVLDVNNVRTTLLTGGDVWWNGSDGRYVVPKVDPGSGQPEVSSIYAGAVWLGGFDLAGNLKIACQQYGTNNGTTDFWPGPLTEIGTTSQDTCADWDQFFQVTGEDIDQHLLNYQLALNGGEDYDPDDIPDGVKFWPGRGNPFFNDPGGYEFELPNTTQGLAGYHDANTNGIYDPDQGDYPIIEIRGCPDIYYPDEMIFWIYNDAGATHTETGGDVIRMEVQVQAFGYETNDEINDMTFMRYKLINRAVESIDSTFFAMWVDPDLGCYLDDYIGCDTSRSLMFIYNQDATDGEPGATCNGVNTYGTEIPVLGVDYFRGPLGPKVFGPDSMLINPANGQPGDTIVELGMSSFTYFNGQGAPSGTEDPGIDTEYYNYLSGSWRDGLRLTRGGDGHNPGSTDFTSFAFPDPPDLLGGWSMAQEDGGLPAGDRRTVQASGPFLLEPGAVNELIVGVVWVPDVDHPDPDISRLQSADDVAQALFDNCFVLPDGPDAPDVDWIELDREIVAVLTNDSLLSNNKFELYEELDLRAPGLVTDSTYVFEGYKLYQLSGPDVGVSEFDDPDKARLVAQADLKNGVTDLFNWVSISNPTFEPGSGAPPFLWVPEPKVEEANNEGSRHLFRITEDQFAQSDKRLVNHKKYYFTALAYGFNEYASFDPSTPEVGQRLPYIEGRKNIGDKEADTDYYTVIPRPIIDRTLNAGFGDGPQVTRLDGLGTGEQFIRLTPESEMDIFENKDGGRVVYQGGSGPIGVTIFNPIDVKEADFELIIVDSDPNDKIIEDTATWIMNEVENGTVVNTITSERDISIFYEQILKEYGIAVTVPQQDIVGSNADDSNGLLGIETAYENPEGVQWYSSVPEGAAFPNLYDFIKTSAGEPDFSLDPNGSLTRIGNGDWVPYTLCDWRPQDAAAPFISPAWIDPNSDIVRVGNGLDSLNNVDIVFTSNPDLWSRCVVVETGNDFYAAQGGNTECNAAQFDLRAGASVGKDGMPDGDGTGMGWFPGYAIDPMSGERLNIFFGENSAITCGGNTNPDCPGSNIYDDLCGLGVFTQGDPTGRDMIWNPNSERFIQTGLQPSIINAVDGGQHFVYVTREQYDGCSKIRTGLGGSNITKLFQLRKVTWTSFPVLPQGQSLLPLDQGLIPNDLKVSLRVARPYTRDQKPKDEQFTGTDVNNKYPTYSFSTKGFAATELVTDAEIDGALDMINVVPNPYYGYSAYETSQFTNVVKVTNLPAKCTVTIYSLDGKFIRQYKRSAEGVSTQNRNNPAIDISQYSPDIEWDLTNNKNIPVASGVYLIHIDAPGLGERVIKWFGVARQFDPSGL